MTEGNLADTCFETNKDVDFYEIKEAKEKKRDS